VTTKDSDSWKALSRINKKQPALPITLDSSGEFDINGYKVDYRHETFGAASSLQSWITSGLL